MFQYVMNFLNMKCLKNLFSENLPNSRLTFGTAAFLVSRGVQEGIFGFTEARQINNMGYTLHDVEYLHQI